MSICMLFLYQSQVKNVWDAINSIFLNIIPNIWIWQAYVQGFDCESITIEEYINMLEHIIIIEYVYEGILEPYY